MAQGTRNNEIEALRALAIFITICAHLRHLFFWAPSWFENTHPHLALSTGVDLFFCISGYLIAAATLKHLPHDRTWYNFKAFALPFWVRRMWRLWPAAFLWLVIYLGASLFFNQSGSFRNPEFNFHNLVAGIFHFANFYFVDCIKTEICGSAAVYWSLSLEEQFYFIFPFVIFFFPRYRLIAFFIVIFLLQVTLDRPTRSLLWAIRTDAMALGVLLALSIERPFVKKIEPKFLAYPGINGLCLLVLGGALLILPKLFNSMQFGVAGVISFVMVWIATYNKGLLIPEGKVRNALAYIGSRSYAIYLCHEAAFFGTREIWFRISPSGTQFDVSYTALFAVTAIILIAIFAEASYRFIEVPLREKGKLIADNFSKSWQHPGATSAALGSRVIPPEIKRT